jgi:hypothetical protein
MLSDLNSESHKLALLFFKVFFTLFHRLAIKGVTTLTKMTLSTMTSSITTLTIMTCIITIIQTDTEHNDGRVLLC